MHIVIDIPESDYELACKYNDVLFSCSHYIRDGIPIPKGHGRLIDADKIHRKLKEHHDFYINAYKGFNNLPSDEKARVDEMTSTIAEIINAPTIIEADKEE